MDSHTLNTLMILQGQIMSEINLKKESKNIHDYEFKVFSQNGEDGIIQFLINKIDIKNKIFVEFGVQNYEESNTRFLLMKDNWSGLIIDGSETNINQVKNSEIAWKNDIKAVCAFITKDNINDLIKKAGIEGEIGILSVDIDGNDYWVYDAINCVNPQIVITEFNSMYGPKANVTVPYDPKFVRSEKHYSNLYWGASITAFTKLAEKKGYDLVGSNSFGNNLFFVRKDCNTTGIKLTPEKAYVKSKFKESRDKQGDLSYLSHDEGLKVISEEKLYNLDTNSIIKVKDIEF